ncbi:hypothetical protein Ctob_012476 [Chrysochromulina tobinii]|uniref:Uncharacterized protein n=1 Tax=Chrysochromulina tobinii TaxID=1460289 RepID=A0A0M0JRL5_9EUKA|nr:hypothetical protein Ctob_012476 [Chrysochromulina tobinii]|eukprot:KOO29120.1 hypothetical protein Ctob_012476 [Chrysochromulina sp. CCMP291]
MQVQIDEAASCGRSYMRLARALRRCIAAQRHRSRPIRSALSQAHEQGWCGAIFDKRQVARKRRSDRPGFVHAEQLYTDAALVLDASTRVAAATGGGLIDLHLHCVVDHADEMGWVAG